MAKLFPHCWYYKIPIQYNPCHLSTKPGWFSRSLSPTYTDTQTPQNRYTDTKTTHRHIHTFTTTHTNTHTHKDQMSVSCYYSTLKFIALSVLRKVYTGWLLHVSAQETGGDGNPHGLFPSPCFKPIYSYNIMNCN